jgi:hypothetical protein
MEMEEKFVPLMQTDVDTLIKDYSYTRPILHKLYGQFKTLLTIAANSHRSYDISKGVDRQTFEN